MMKIAFIGLGNMGLPMALNLQAKGYELCVYDVNDEAMRVMADKGCLTASSPKDCANDMDVVITMLPSAQIVEAVYQGDDPIAEADHIPAFWIDCSTIDASTSRKMAALAVDKGAVMLDAPVSGGVGGAKAGTLTFMVGGDAEALEKIQPIFEAMGKDVFHAGASGAGQIAKICNNMLLAISMIGTSEALALGQEHGLDAAVLSEIMAKSSGSNWVLNVYNPVPDVMDDVPASNDYKGGFLSGLMMKDLSLAMSACEQSEHNSALGQAAFNLYKEHCENGAKEIDFSSIYQMIYPPHQDS